MVGANHPATEIFCGSTPGGSIIAICSKTWMRGLKEKGEDRDD